MYSFKNRFKASINNINKIFSNISNPKLNASDFIQLLDEFLFSLFQVIDNQNDSNKSTDIDIHFKKSKRFKNDLKIFKGLKCVYNISKHHAKHIGYIRREPFILNKSKLNGTDVIFGDLIWHIDASNKKLHKLILSDFQVSCYINYIKNRSVVSTLKEIKCVLQDVKDGNSFR